MVIFLKSYFCEFSTHTHTHPERKRGDGMTLCTIRAFHFSVKVHRFVLTSLAAVIQSYIAKPVDHGVDRLEVKYEL